MKKGRRPRRRPRLKLSDKAGPDQCPVPGENALFPAQIAGFLAVSRAVPVYPVFLNYVVPVHVPRRLFVVGAEQEGHDLSTGAVIIGTEQPAADAGGDAVCCSPCHRIRIVRVFGNIAELRCTLCPGT